MAMCVLLTSPPVVYDIDTAAHGCLLQSVEFEISRDYIGRIVGTGGASVNKLRDALGVNVDFSDEQDKGDDGAGKPKKKKTAALAKVKVRSTLTCVSPTTFTLVYLIC